MKLLLAAIGLVATMVATAASAHVTMAPAQAVAGAQQKYVVRVPNERTVPTTKLVGEFPTEVVVTAVDEAQGWKVEARRDDRGRIIGATWTGDLAAGKSTEFGLQARNPSAAGTISWKFIQTYADGVTREWTGARGSASPAPQVQITPAP